MNILDTSNTRLMMTQPPVDVTLIALVLRRPSVPRSKMAIFTPTYNHINILGTTVAASASSLVYCEDLTVAPAIRL
jgi:hypothetical protein